MTNQNDKKTDKTATPSDKALKESLENAKFDRMEKQAKAALGDDKPA